MALGVFLALPLLSGCVQTPWDSSESSYEILSKIAGEADESHFNLPKLLQALYPDSQAVVAASVDGQGEGIVSLSVHEVIDGYVPGSNLRVHNPTAHRLEEGNRYLLFLSAPTLYDEENTIHYDLLADESGFLLLRDQVLYPAPGITMDLELVKNELHELSMYVSAPSYALYYQTLAALVEGSDLIFVGTVTQAEFGVPIDYYVREEGFAEMYTEDTRRFTIQPETMIKGEAADEFTVLLPPIMAKNTLNEGSLDHTAYTEIDMPGIYAEGKYLFFLVNSPGGKRGAYRFFVNPFQGAVPVLGSVLSPIPVNAVFSMQEDLDGILSRIASLLGGEDDADGAWPSYEIDVWDGGGWMDDGEEWP